MNILQTERLVALIVILMGVLGTNTAHAQSGTNPARQAGLVPVDCWFEAKADWPASECYRMYVPEDHAKPRGRMISFPVLLFRNPKPVADRAPLLHLGAGGPGASMYLDFDYSVAQIWQESQVAWLEQGRDFIVIDPRGAGLSEPLLVCDTYIKNIIGHLQKNLSTVEMLTLTGLDYQDCIRRFRKQGIELAAYNSLSVAQDMEQLRLALGIKQWVLYGVSYGTVYAQLIANEYPDSVRGMVLDSTAFPDLMPHNYYLETVLAPFEAMYNYCERSRNCTQPLGNFKQRFWRLYEKFGANPVMLAIPDPRDLDKQISLPLNGNLFVETMWYSLLYSTDIYDALPETLVKLEQGETDDFGHDVAGYISFLLDDTFADVSFDAHYCFGTKPFTSIDLVKKLSMLLPEGYVRETALLQANWDDLCDDMGINDGDPRAAMTIRTDIPTLFLQGELDIATPLKRVQLKRKNFRNSQLITYPVGHGVLGVHECGDDAIAAFLLDAQADLDKVDCRVAEK